MFLLYADKARLEVLKKDTITNGSANAFRACFVFSEDWVGLTRKVVFIGSGTQISVELDETGQCVIPWEVCTRRGDYIYAGVFGAKEETALPTIKVSLGVILEGIAAGGTESLPPSIPQDKIDEIMARLNNIPSPLTALTTEQLEKLLGRSDAATPELVTDDNEVTEPIEDEGSSGEGIKEIPDGSDAEPPAEDEESSVDIGAQFLNADGALFLWNKMKEYIEEKLSAMNGG